MISRLLQRRYQPVPTQVLPKQKPIVATADHVLALRRRRRCAAILLLLILVSSLAALAFYVLARFSAFNILQVIGLVHGGSHGIPTCIASTFPMRLVYDPDGQQIVDISGSGCSVEVGTTLITGSGVDSVVGPYWTGHHQRAFDLQGCTSYSWTQWMKLNNAIQLSSRVMSIYSTQNPSTGPFPLTAFLAGCGLAVLGSHTYAIPQDTWAHVAIVYDGVHRTNTWFIDGVQVFSWAAYTDPPPHPYLSGTMTLDMLSAIGQVSFGETHLYCTALNAASVISDAALVTPHFPFLAKAYPSTPTTATQPLPAYTHAGNTDTNDLHSFFCVFPTPASDAAIPSALPNTYTTFYIDQVNGQDSSSGMGTDSLAWKTLENPTIFSNLAYDFAILTPATAFNSSVVQASGTAPLQFRVAPTIVSGSSLLNNRCNLWRFVNANTGSVNYVVGQRSPDSSSSMWLYVNSVSGTVHLPPSGGYSQGSGDSYQGGPITTWITPSSTDSSSYIYSFGSSATVLQTVLQYNTAYYVTQVWSCSMQTMHLYVNGQLIQQQIGNLGICPYLVPGTLTPFISTDGGANTFTGFLGAMSLHLTSLSASAVQALYQLMSQPTSTCALAELCLAIKLCANDRHFAAIQGLSAMSAGPNCPFFLGAYDCGRGSDSPLISGAVILPQTSTVGWQALTDWVNPSTGLHRNDVLQYDLVALYEATATDFLPGDPRLPTNRYQRLAFPPASNGQGSISLVPVYMPIVMNDLYMTPRMPNIDDPRYLLGNRFYHTLHALSYLSDGKDLENSSPNPGYYSPAYYAANSHLQPSPGSWCNATWNQMFNHSTQLYLQFDVTKLNTGTVWAFQFNYVDGGFPPMTLTSVGNALIDCQQWMQSEIAANGLNANWKDPSLAMYGLASTTYQIPQCKPACTRFTEYLDEIRPPPHDQPMMPFTANPLGQPPAGWLSSNSYYVHGDFFNTVFFDAPGEAYYDPAQNVVRLIPWNAQHRQQLLTTTSIALDAITVAQNPAATVNWVRLVDVNTRLGVSAGSTAWMRTVSKAGAIIQDVAISHYNGWGLYVVTEQPSRIENVAMSYNLNHIHLGTNTGASFVVGSTMVNTTRPWYGLSVDSDGRGVECQSGASATCAVIDSDIVTTIGATVVNFVRGSRIVDNSGQSALTSTTNQLWIEHTLFNITENFVGDAGVLYSSPNPTTLLWNKFDNTQFSQSTNLNPQPAYFFGSYKAGFPRTAGYWIGQSLVWHGNQFLNIVGDIVGLTGGANAMSYNLDSFAQFTSNLITGGSFTFVTPDGTQTVPSSPQAASGRPWGINNSYAIYDDVQYNPIAVAYDYPIFGPGFQGGSPLWRWSNNDVSSWIHNLHTCYAQLDYVGGGGASLQARDLAQTTSYTGVKVPGSMTRSISSALADWAMSSANGSPQPQFGPSACSSMKTAVQQQLTNEAQLHYQSTDAAMTAIIRSQMPFSVPTLTSQLTEASEWEESMSRYNPSGDPWPVEQDNALCSDITSCDPTYLLTHLVSVLPTSEWRDAKNAAILTYTGFNGAGQFGPTNPAYVGNSYDVIRGVVMDTCLAQGLTYSLTVPRKYPQFTVMFWWLIPTMVTTHGIMALNRNQATFLTMGGNNGNTAGGTIFSDSQGLFGQSGGATATMKNANSGCCPFNSIPMPDGINCQSDRSRMDQWVHFTASVSLDYSYTRLFQNGQPVFDCVTFGGQAASIQPVWGGPTPMAFLSLFSGKVSDFRVYAGKLSDSTVHAIYTQSQATYAGPALFNGNSVHVAYSPGLQTFTISSTETQYTVAFLGQFNRSFLVADPTGATPTPVIHPQAQFSFPVPLGLSSWSVNVEVLWTAPPTFSPWWHIPSSSQPGNVDLLVMILGGTRMCLYQGFTTNNDGTPNYNQQACLSNVPFPLHQWTNYTITSSSQLYVNNQDIGQFGSGPLPSTQRSILFQIPPQYWMYTQQQLSSASINSGYIRTVQVYSSFVYTV